MVALLLLSRVSVLFLYAYIEHQTVYFVNGGLEMGSTCKRKKVQGVVERPSLQRFEGICCLCCLVIHHVLVAVINQS